MTIEIGSRSVAVRTLAVAVLALLSILALGGVARAALNQPEPTISCDVADSVYGTPITCTAAGHGVAGLLWPDGHVADTPASSHGPMAVGSLAVHAIDEAGTTLASAAVNIRPDIEIVCEDGSERPIYELEKTDLNPNGWDYVYVDANGTTIRPGDAEHPNGGLTDLELVEIDRAIATSFCELNSVAATELEGEMSFTLESPWEPTITRPRIVSTHSKTRWEGTQPAELIGTVTIGTVEASERRGIYMSGCN